MYLNNSLELYLTKQGHVDRTVDLRGQWRLHECFWIGLNRHDPVCSEKKSLVIYAGSYIILKHLPNELVFDKALLGPC